MVKAKTPDMSQWASNMDLDATRALIDELQTEGKPWDKIESSPKKYVTNFRRICPKRPEWQNPYQIVPVHYLGPSNRMTVCLKDAGLGNCPACTLRWQLQDGGDEQAARKLRPSIRTFLNVVRINEDGSLAEEKVFLMGLNQLQFLGKRGVEYDPEEEDELPLFYFFEKYGDLSHVETGRDLLIKAKDDKQGDFEMVKMKFSAADPSPFPGTGELLEGGLIDLPAVVAVNDEAEMVAMIEGRATGALMLGSGTPAAATALPEATTVAEAPKSRFGGEEEDTEEEETPAEAEAPVEPAEESSEESTETPSNPRAAKKPPETDPKAALARLRGSKE